MIHFDFHYVYGIIEVNLFLVRTNVLAKIGNGKEVKEIQMCVRLKTPSGSQVQ